MKIDIRSKKKKKKKEIRGEGDHKRIFGKKYENKLKTNRCIRSIGRIRSFLRQR